MLKLSIIQSSLLLLLAVVAHTSASLRKSDDGSKTTRSLELEAQSNVVVHRINCGVSSDFTDTNGFTWSADAYFLNGMGVGILQEFFGFGNSKLFETYREQPRWFAETTTLNYEFPVSAGDTYVVAMIFPQRSNWFGLRPPAKQNIYVNGVLQFNELELTDESQFPVNALRVQTEPILVECGSLSIAFESSTDSPAVSGISIYKITPGIVAPPTDTHPAPAPVAAPVPKSVPAPVPVQAPVRAPAPVHATVPTPVSIPAPVVEPPVPFSVPAPGPAPAPVVPPPTPSAGITGFKLIYTPTNEEVFDLYNNAVVSLGSLGLTSANFNVKAQNSGSLVQSVRFHPNGQNESNEPFAYCGDVGGNYNTCSTFQVGMMHTISVTPFTGPFQTGEALPDVSVTFWIVDAVAAPVPKSVPAPIPVPAPVTVPVSQVASPSDYTWQFRQPLPIDLGEMAAASDGQYVYVLTGHLDTWSNIRSLYRYDPTSDSWTTLAEQNVVPGVNHATVQYLDGKIYQIGGFTPETNAVAIYDIATNTWSTGTPLTMSGSAYTLASASNAVIDGKIYMAGGLHNNNANGNPPHTFVYDPKDGPGGSWKQLADMPAEHARNHGCGVSYNGKLYVFAGRRGPNGGRDGIKSSLVFDPASNSWSMLPDIPTPRAGMGNCVELNGELYVIGGENPGTVENNVEAYNPVTNKWNIKDPMQVGRHGIYPVKRGNVIHIVGGGDERDFSNSNWHEVYAP